MQTIEKLLSMISISQMCSVARNLELLLAHPKVWNPVNNWFTYVSWPATATTLNHCVLVFNVSPSSFLSFVLVLISILYLSNLITSFSALNHLRWNILADIYLTRSGQLSLHVDSIWQAIIEMELELVETEYREMLFRLETERSDQELYRIIAQSIPVQMMSY